MTNLHAGRAPDARRTDEQKWKASVEKGRTHELAMHRRLRLVATVVAAGLGLGVIAAFLRG